MPCNLLVVDVNAMRQVYVDLDGAHHGSLAEFWLLLDGVCFLGCRGFVLRTVMVGDSLPGTARHLHFLHFP
jgi:hypothetical protein